MKLKLPLLKTNQPLSVMAKDATTHEATQDPPKPNAIIPAAKSPEEKVNAILLSSPDLNAPTFLNILKSQGLKITEASKKKEPAAYDRCVKKVAAKGNVDNPYAVCKVSMGLTKESAKKFKLKMCNSGTAFGAIQRESLKWRSTFTNNTKMVESSAVDNGIGPTRFRVVLIREGLGNLRDGYYYTEQALSSAIPVFEGKKCYANHPSADEEKTRPERDVRDIIGHFENVRVGKDEAGAAQLEADLVVMPDPQYAWARAQILHSIDYAKKFPDKDFVGLSINANGDAEAMEANTFMSTMPIPQTSLTKVKDAMAGGLNTVRIVNKITDATSVDMVTEAGAGGRFVSIIK